MNDPTGNAKNALAAAEEEASYWRARYIEMDAKHFAAQRELAAAYCELRKIRPAVRAVFNRDVWERAQAIVEDKR